MRHRLFYASGLLALATLVLVARPAAAQTTANGPYYATPAWDQTLACTTLATCPRFIVLSNMDSNAVLDRETGLVWEKSPRIIGPPQQWGSAHILCNELTTGGRLGWRLPTLQELASLVDRSVPGPGPKLPAGHPFTDVQSAGYWSATTRAEFSSNVAWYVLFDQGFVNFRPVDDLFHFWCVRGGRGVDGQ